MPSSSASSLGLTSSLTAVSQARKTGAPFSMAIAVPASIAGLLRQPSPGGKTVRPLTEACRLGHATLSIGATSARFDMISSTGALAPEPATARYLIFLKRVGAQVSGGVPVK